MSDAFARRVTRVSGCAGYKLGEQLTLHPTGLTREQFRRLAEFADQGGALSVGDLLAEVQRHLSATAAAFERNSLVNVRLAQAIADTIARITIEWDALPPAARNWLAGAILYFTKCQDDIPDFSSPIGFEDDVEVLNACLRFARRPELCLKPEEYDGA